MPDRCPVCGHPGRYIGQHGTRGSAGVTSAGSVCWVDDDERTALWVHDRHSNPERHD